MKIIIDDQYYDEDDKMQINISDNRQRVEVEDYFDKYNDVSKESEGNRTSNYIGDTNSSNFNITIESEEVENINKRNLRNNNPNSSFYPNNQYEEINNIDNAYEKYYNSENLNSLREHPDNSNNLGGVITVYSKLGDVNGIEIRGAKINLYELNGVNPKLCQSLLTGADGKVEFTNLKDGCYRVVAIVDRRYFDKPRYITWNEVTINHNTRNAVIHVVNIIKNGVRR